MNLSKKNLFYSLAIATVIVSLIICYFSLMLPSLYVDYNREKNVEAIYELQLNYIKNKNYDDLVLRNPSATITLEIPKDGNELYLYNTFFEIQIELKDEDFINLLNHLQEKINNSDKEWDDSLIDVDSLIDKLLPKEDFFDDYPFELKFKFNVGELTFKDPEIRFYQRTDDIFITEFSVSDGVNNFTNYMAFTTENDHTTITMMSVMSPDMNDIRPIIFQSLPMIVVVTFLFILIFSQIFSNGIIQPILKIFHHV